MLNFSNKVRILCDILKNDNTCRNSYTNIKFCLRRLYYFFQPIKLSWSMNTVSSPELHCGFVVNNAWGSEGKRKSRVNVTKYQQLMNLGGEFSALCYIIFATSLKFFLKYSSLLNENKNYIKNAHAMSLALALDFRMCWSWVKIKHEGHGQNLAYVNIAHLAIY